MINSDTIYRNERHRPQYHFSPDSMWMNDPNGMVFYEGEYHLFYQYYPDSTVWGPMHWGHAISPDLVHWENLPIALYPDSLGYIFSGSAVADLKNTSGFGTTENPPLLAIFTYHDIIGERSGKQNYQSQGIAYSLDKGRSWTKYPKNPVLSNPGIRDFRDPKVSWHEPTQQWVMVIAAGDHVRFYTSENLISWNYESSFGKDTASQEGVWECPDLFRMKVKNGNQDKWILLVSISPGGPNGGSATQYFIGDFDGHRFKNESKTIQWIDYGKDNYAGVTWSNIPEKDGRTIFLGWMSNWQYAQLVPTHPWRSAMTIPRELDLLKSENGFFINSRPVSELDRIKTKEVDLESQKIFKKLDISDIIHFSMDQTEIQLCFRVPEKLPEDQPVSVGFSLNNVNNDSLSIGYDLVANNFYIDRNYLISEEFSPEFAGMHIAPFELRDSIIKMHVLVDRSSIEAFFMDGRITMTDIYFVSQKFESLILFSNNINVELIEGRITRINEIW